MFFQKTEEARVDEESSSENGGSLNDNMNESTKAISSEKEDENVNEDETEEDRYFREICFRWPSVYATEQERGRTVVRCLICDEIKDSITGSTNGLRSALHHTHDPYHRDQVTNFNSLTFAP